MLRIGRITIGLGALALGASACAHSGEAHEAAPAWTLAPSIVIPLAVVLAQFLLGRSELARRSNVARPRQALFLAGWLVLALTLVSPVHEGGERSFTLHMIEHELIMLVATFLLAASHSGGVLAWGLPGVLRHGLGGGWSGPLRALWREAPRPVTATIVQAVVMWAWHAPALFDRALASPSWHIAQHLSFLLSSLAFWSAILNHRGCALLAALCLFVTSLVEGALGALMALSTSAWYSAYAGMALSGIGLDPATDQQLAGLLRWIPGGLVHGAGALLLLYRWLSRAEGNYAPARD